jgi:hypothetical protein
MTDPEEPDYDPQRDRDSGIALIILFEIFAPAPLAMMQCARYG